MGVQVETLTKDKSMHETEYIDFSYKGKKLSEFGLVVVSNGDRLSFGHSPNFEDEITQVNGSNGQLFWGTHFKNFQRTFHLATDGMSEAQWNAFKRHFIPGQYGEFIEHHLPSRKSYCRVREISVLNIIPFQETITLYGEQVQVNVYKGDCSISFEWDDPHYYSISNYITENEWNSPTSKADSIRAMYTDNIPRYNSWTGDSLCCIGDKEYYLQKPADKTSIDEPSTDEPDNNNTITASQFCFYNPSTVSTDCQLELKLPYTLVLHTVENGENGFDISYIDTIGDTYNSNKNDSMIVKKIIGKNSEGEEIAEEITATKYTSPNIIYQINKAIYIATNYYKNNITWNIIDLEEQLREEITNPKVMSWAANAIRAMSHKKSTPVVNPEDSTGENTGGNTEGEENTEGNTEGNTSGNGGENTGEDTGESTGENTETNTETNTEGNGGENSGEDTEGTTEEAPEENNSPEYVLGRYCNEAGVLIKDPEDSDSPIQLDFSVKLPGDDSALTKNGNWLQFFNSYMLTFFGKVKVAELPEGEEPTEISTLNWLDEGVNLNYENFTLKFDSKLHEAYFSYNYNNIVNELQNISVKEEKCGDIMLSDYLKLDGGDSLDEDSGNIATYHTLSFIHGEKTNEEAEADKITEAKLIYQYVYL